VRKTNQRGTKVTIKRGYSLRSLAALVAVAFLMSAVPAHATTPTAKAKLKDPVITALGWDRYDLTDPEEFGGCTQYLFVIKNPNKKALISFPEVRVTARDANGRILGTEEVVTESLAPRRSAGWDDIICSRQAPSTVTATVIPSDRSDFVPTKAKQRAFKPFPATNVGWSAFPSGDVEISGEVTNLFATPQDVRVTVALEDAAGNVVGGGTQTLDGLRRNDPTPFFIEDNIAWLDGVPVVARAYVNPNDYPGIYEKVASKR
jgi:hypothetical protein